jgi:hypothetical protein
MIALNHALDPPEAHPHHNAPDDPLRTDRFDDNPVRDN